MKKKLTALALALLTLLPLAACGKKEPATDLAYIQDKGYLTVGVTEFAPMDYLDADGKWIGFDADLARAFAKGLGVDAVFQTIEWDDKHKDLQDKKIDVVWNGMTLTDTVRAQMAVSRPYCRNAQVVVVPADVAADYATEDALKSLDFVAEDNSAGARALSEVGLVCVPVEDQAQALRKVAEGTAEACVIDQFMAAAMTGPDTQYPDLAVAMELGNTSEDIVVGFRQGSDLVDAFDQFWETACADGTVDAATETYRMSSFVLKAAQ